MIALLASILLQASLLACEFSPSLEKVYSLSGPVSLALRDLNLLRSSKLRGVSIFHPIEKSSFKGAFLPGGIFLSHKALSEMAGSLLFYDESRELSRILSRYEGIRAIEVKTRGRTPLEVAQLLETTLKPLVQECDLDRLSTNLKESLDSLRQLAPKNMSVLLFLGAIKNGRWPELLMVNDGIMKWLVQEKLLRTFPSDLSYVNWSSRMLNSMPKATLKVGLKDSGNELKSHIEKNADFINVTFPGALIPGSGQVEAMIYLFKNL